MSLNDAPNLLNFVHQIIDMFECDLKELKEQKLFNVLMESLNQFPYLFLRLLLLMLAHKSKKEAM